MSTQPAHKSFESDPTVDAASTPPQFDSTELLVASCLLHLFLDSNDSSRAPASTLADTHFAAISGFRNSSQQVRKRRRGDDESVPMPRHGADVHGRTGVRSKVPRYRNLSDVYSKSASVE
ncbi:hypothetical protein KP509_09G070600 [Ceratopteris richardii]|uniref:Uncharacterized protein n=1 Tax=Ceratopteris richardii TaxID=49495 RepID=A0A8T2U5F4_CERRI|nr:hypothetical protein KP509_09G070600 [Ceratopteris richardii]